MAGCRAHNSTDSGTAAASGKIRNERLIGTLKANQMYNAAQGIVPVAIVHRCDPPSRS